MRLDAIAQEPEGGFRGAALWQRRMQVFRVHQSRDLEGNHIEFSLKLDGLQSSCSIVYYGMAADQLSVWRAWTEVDNGKTTL